MHTNPTLSPDFFLYPAAKCDGHPASIHSQRNSPSLWKNWNLELSLVLPLGLCKCSKFQHSISCLLSGLSWITSGRPLLRCTWLSRIMQLGKGMCPPSEACPPNSGEDCTFPVSTSRKCSGGMEAPRFSKIGKKAMEACEVRG